jgi:hypothetical protein
MKAPFAALSLASLASLGLMLNVVHAQDAAGPAASADLARGTVFLDRNRNGRMDPSEPGIRDVSVSNGLDVVRTDARGRYAISLPPESILFVSKPAEYEVPVDKNNLPKFYYTHYPNGSPPVAQWQRQLRDPRAAFLGGRDRSRR